MRFQKRLDGGGLTPWIQRLRRGSAIALPIAAMRTCVRDVKFALRVLQSNPGFTVVAVLTLGLGVACTTTSFSWVDTVLLHPYPGTADSERLAPFEMISPNAPNGGTSVSWLDYRDFRDNLRTVA